VARLTIRRATLADLEALLELEQLFPGDRIGRSSFRHLLSAGKADIWLVQRHKQIIANAVVFYRKNALQARLYSLIVHPLARGQGLGSKLLRHAEKAAQARGYQGMRLEVRADNHAAIGLYKRAGYHLKATIPAYYDDRCAALKMQKIFEL
jgi:ribosomal protein S18 acetylase RimI-like enzyme